MNNLLSVRSRVGAEFTPLILLGFAIALVLSAPPAFAQAEPADPSHGFHQVEVDGFVSAGVNYSQNRPHSRTNQYRVFDQNEGDFQVDAAELVFQRNPVSRGESGFRLDLTAGASIPRVVAAAGLFRDDEGQGEDIDVQQAMVSTILPVGHGLRVDLGKHVTHTGYEVIEGYDGYNDQATRSFLFGYAIPFTHTGIRVGYTFSPKIAGVLYLVNGWDNVRDNNRAKSLGAQVMLAPLAGTSVFLNYLGGAEQEGNDSNLRHLFDLVGTYKPSDRISCGINLDYAMEEKALESGGDAMWRGAALYARAAVSSPFSVTARGEVFEDEDGFRTGVKQTLRSVTLTPELKVGGDLLVRADLRLDRSSERVFEKESRPASEKTQSTVSLNAIYLF